MKWQAGLLAVAAGTLLFLGSAGTAKAHPSNRQCFERIQREQGKLQREIRRHGVFSRQAQNRRTAIARLRHQCGQRFRSGRNRIPFTGFVEACPQAIATLKNRLRDAR